MRAPQVGDDWIEVEEMDAKKMARTEANGGRDGQRNFAKMKMSEVVKMAREAARDKEKLKDPDVKKALRYWKVDLKSPTAILDSVKKIQQEQRSAGLEKGKREETSKEDIKHKARALY